MSDVGGFLFGKSPKAIQEPGRSTISPTQQGVQGNLAGYLNALLGTSQSPNPTAAYPGQLTAQLTPQQTSIIDQIVGQTGGGTPASTTQNASMQALQSIFGSTPADTTNYFNQAIAAPLENTFSTQTLPAIKAAFAQSAGGNYSTASGTAAGMAANSLNQNLASQGASVALQSLFQNQQNKLNAASLTPNVTASPINNLVGALNAATLPQQTAQSTLSNQYSQYQNQVTQLFNLLGLGTTFSGTPTVSGPQTVGLPGTTGLIQSLIGALGSTGAAAALI